MTAGDGVTGAGFPPPVWLAWIPHRSGCVLPFEYGVERHVYGKQRGADLRTLGTEPEKSVVPSEMISMLSSPGHPERAARVFYGFIDRFSFNFHYVHCLNLPRL